jgi:hypothetical protein
MLRKVAQGVNIFEELDKYIASGDREVENHGSGINLHSSFLPNPRTITRYPNKPRQRGQRPPNRRHRHSFPFSNEAEKNFPSASETVQPPFQPVTTSTVTTTKVATVTTTTVGNHNHHHPFQYQGHHYYGARHHNRSYHYHPYQYTPSFDSIALFPTTQPYFQHQSSTFQESMTMAAYQDSNLPIGNNLFDAEVEAVEALLGIRAATENYPPQRVEL